ncbi:interleukin-18 receptor 1 [Hemicordylus capensis]|uniref:interleukin-18 receptor 1 n=1 Tax=Hemicordylus capensis TaxID=884348 RepID=UPI0023025F24|nr:interleukin-18 receptor 1 [Hemicordylus capensis]XP_053167130.1 interleukin-18 receptor 1 [Hemicordylus capensis]XP_053167131.1 interleukin-18 receptor 1 [Hemicordylus capensis]XP_053167132.1 interleukin-18 receptor 1 [Hemicordylus capensis]
MCFGNLSVVLLLCFVSPGNLCRVLSSIDTIEEEYFSNCCPNIKQDEGYTLNWYREKEGKLILIQEANRIVLNGSYLEFWPAKLNDTGKYICSISNGTHNVTQGDWNLRVLKKDKDSCFNANHVSRGKPGIIGESYSFKCSDILHNTDAVNITWYKNCSYVNEGDWYIPKLTVGDSGNYTCVATLLRAGNMYYRTSTIELEVEQAPEDNTKPALTGTDPVFVETEIGKTEILNCTAVLGSSNNSYSGIEIYWLHNKQLIEICPKNNNDFSLCEMEDHKYHKEGKHYLLKQLRIKSIKEEDISSSYICRLSLVGDYKNQTFILKKGHNPDLTLRGFTTGMIMVTLFSLLAIFVVILCAIFRVDLVLLYRDITQKDETLGDGKIYDAFVSYLKDCAPICGEERKFALEILPAALEEHFGYKLCIFERDISPGGAVVDDVQSYIDQSRRLIIILSKNYVLDKVMFELETGLHKALVERKIKVILIEYRSMSDFNFLPKSLELLSSSQVVKWKEEKSLPLHSRFWKKLRYVMPAKSSAANTPAIFHGIHTRQNKTWNTSKTKQEQLMCPASHLEKYP